MVLRGSSSLGEQEPACGNGERGVMMKAAPATTLVVAKAELLPQLLIVALDPPAQLGRIRPDHGACYLQ